MTNFKITLHHRFNLIVLCLLFNTALNAQDSLIHPKILSELNHIDSIIPSHPEKGLSQSKALLKKARDSHDFRVQANALQLKAWALTNLEKREEAAFANMECAHTLINNDIPDSSLIATCFLQAANNYFFLGLFDLAKELGLTSLKHVPKKKLDQAQISSYSLLGDVFLRQGDYEQSLVYYDSCYQIDLHLKDTTYISADLTMLGRINTKLGRKEEGLALIQEAIDILDKTKHRSEFSVAYNALGLAYSNLGEFEPADENIVKALRIGEELDNDWLIINRLVNLCDLHTKFEKYDSANRYCQQCLELIKDDFEPNRFTIVHQNLGKIYHAKGYPKLAQESLDKAIEMAKRGNQLPQIKEIYHTMAQQYLKSNQHKLAFEYMDKYQLISDSIFSLNAHVKANALKFKYETAKKEAEIKSLKLNNEIKERNLVSMRERQRAILLFSLFIATLGIMSFLLYRQKQKNEIKHKEREINNQLNVISTLQKEIAHALDQKTANINSLSLTEINELISENLTQREYEILELVLQGNTNQEIADKVFLSINTIKFHLKKIYAKLDVSNRLEIMQLLLKK